MTVQQVIGLALRLCALLLLSMALGDIRAAVAYADSAGVMYFSALLNVAMAAYLWFFPMSLAHRLLPQTHFKDKIITNTNQLAVAGVDLLGLWLFVTALELMIYDLSLAAMVDNAANSIFSTLTATSEAKANLVAKVARLSMGLFLLLKSRKVVRWITA